VVLDTNVLLAGMLTRGLCEALLDACTGSGSCVVATSDFILSEFAKHAGGKFRLTPEEVSEAVAFLRRRCEVVEPAAVPSDLCDDPDDLPVLGTAVAARADALVTGDAGLLRCKQVGGIPVVSPRAFYESLR
jgi:putative PIN family toxin of toxin-antitoxin system